VLKAVGSAISLGKDDPGKEDVVNTVRKQTNAWVAKYRRDSTFAGRPSYGCAPQPLRGASAVQSPPDAWTASAAEQVRHRSGCREGGVATMAPQSCLCTRLSSEHPPSHSCACHAQD
jgi:hypothetical protein